jgi:hypothetical protein
MGFGVYQAVTQRDDVARAVDGCMQDIVAKRTEAAMQRFSSRAIEHGLVTRGQVEKLADDRHFRDYQAVEVKTINVSQAFNTNPKTPQGTVASVGGTVSYKGGGNGVFRATLEKEDAQWRLFSLRVERKGAGPASGEDDADKN